MGGAIKQIAILAAIVIAIAGWTMRNAPRMSEASASKSAVPPSPAQADYERRVRDNAPLRARLKEKYPEVYRDLANQTHRDLEGCVVTEVVVGMLKATCLQ